jgi:hypothetical protein
VAQETKTRSPGSNESLLSSVCKTIRKVGEPSLLTVEATKARQAHEIGESSGLFYVPKVVNFDREAGALEFEQLNDLVTLQEMRIRRDDRLLGLLKRTGQILATVHEKLVLPEEMKFQLPPEWMDSPEQNVFIHGDFTLCNVCFHEPSERLVILDWSAAPFLGRTPTYGSRFFDIIWLLIYIFYGTPRKRLFNRDASDMANAFLCGYAQYHPEVIHHLSEELVPLMRRYYRKVVWHLAQQKSYCRAIRYVLYQSFIYPRFVCYRPEQRYDR